MVIQLMDNHMSIQDFLVYKLIKNLIYKNKVNKNENKLIILIKKQVFINGSVLEL